MSITITGRFPHPYEARQAAQKLRRRGYTVSMPKERKHTGLPENPILVAYPFGQMGGNSSGNNLMGALPPLAGNGIRIRNDEPKTENLVTVLTDDTHARDARLLMESLGGILVP